MEPIVVFAESVDYRTILEKLREDFLRRWGAQKSSPCTGLDNFMVIGLLGTGAFGRVTLVKHKQTKEPYAAKELNKEKIIKRKQVVHVLNEKKVLDSVRFPFMVHLVSSFKDDRHLYLILPFIPGGELFAYHRKLQKFTEKQARFYAGQVYLGLEYMHHMNLIYRDLKPENLLLDSIGYIKITDFGFTKRVETRTMTLCGTPEYMAPEIIKSTPYGNSVDWWAFGVLIYEFVAGHSPFVSRNHNELEMFSKICDGSYHMVATFSKELQDLILHLLEPDMTKRYGNVIHGNKRIKEHAWFRDVEWIGLLNKRIVPPYIPKLSGPDDISQFQKVRDKAPPRTLPVTWLRDDPFINF